MPTIPSVAAPAPPRLKRADVKPRWSVSADVTTYSELAGVPLDEMYQSARAAAHAFRVGAPLAREMFGPDVAYSGPAFYTVSYGHINCLGSPLRFPRDSEVAHSPIYDSLAQGVRALEQPIDWASTGMMPQFLQAWREFRELMPEQNLGFWTFRSQGPFTTAWALRGPDFFTDLYDDPPLFARFMELIVDSIVSFREFQRGVNGQSGRAGGAFVTDDIAAMVPPSLWPDAVLPVMERFFAAQTDGSRGAHIEDLVPEHLPHLEAMQLSTFDPSVSPRIRPRDLRDRTSIVFGWLLNPMQTRDFTAPQIHDYLAEALRDGASTLECHIARDTVRQSLAGKIAMFIAAAKEAVSSGQ